MHLYSFLNLYFFYVDLSAFEGWERDGTMPLIAPHYDSYDTRKMFEHKLNQICPIQLA